MNATAEQIDQVILATCGERFAKVALVIAMTLEGLGVSTEEGDQGLALIAKRVEALVADGRLISHGDLEKWRFSEVRQP